MRQQTSLSKDMTDGPHKEAVAGVANEGARQAGGQPQALARNSHIGTAQDQCVHTIDASNAPRPVCDRKGLAASLARTSPSFLHQRPRWLARN